MERPFLQKLRVYRTLLLQPATLVIAGLLGFLSNVDTVIGWFVPALRQPLSEFINRIPLWGWAIIFLVGVLWAISRRSVNTIVEKDDRISELEKPRIEIRCREGEPPYTQAGPLQSDESIYQYRFRIGVHNGGGSPTGNVKVMLQSTDPDSVNYLPVELNPMHGVDKPINSGDENYYDVLYINTQFIQGETTRRLFIFSDAPKFRRSLKIQDYTLAISASTSNSKKVTREFRFVVVNNDHDEYRFYLMPEPPATGVQL